MGDMDELRDQIKDRLSTTPGDELDLLATKLHAEIQASSAISEQRLTDVAVSFKADLAKLVQLSDASTRNVSRFITDIESLRQEVHANSGKQSPSAMSERDLELLRSDVANSLKDELTHLNKTAHTCSEKVSNAVEDVEALRAEIRATSSSQGRNASVEKGIEALQKEVAALRKVELAHPPNVGSGNTKLVADLVRTVREDEDAERAAHHKLVTRINELCGRLGEIEEAAGVAGKVEALQKEVAALRKVELAPPPNVGSGNTKLVADLVRTVREDEDTERAAHHKLLTRINELCGRLGEVEEAAGVAGTDFAQQLETVVNRVEERFARGQ